MNPGKNAPQHSTTPAPAHGSGKENGAGKPIEEEGKDARFQGTGDSELNTTPPAKEGTEGEAPGKDRKSHGAESDTEE